MSRDCPLPRGGVQPLVYLPGLEEGYWEDYEVFLKDDFDRPWFDVVIEGISDYPVLFHRDIGNRKGDRLSWKIVEVGIGLHHKYRGIVVAKIEAS